MKLPRDLSGEELARALRRLGYARTRQTSSHLRPTTTRGGEHRIAVSRHSPLRVGTLAAILDDVAAHAGLSRDELLARVFG